MPETTPNGAPYPLPSDPNDVPGYLKALAEWADEQLAAGAELNDATMKAALESGGLFATAVTASIDGVVAPAVATEEARSNAAYAPKQIAPTTAAAVGVYDRRLNVYNLKPKHLRKARARLAAARAGVGTFSWAMVGDSTAAGVGAAVATTSLPALVASLLSARGVLLTSSGLALGTYGTINDVRVTKTGTWGARSGDANMAFTVTGGDKIVFAFTATDGIQLQLFFGRKSTAFTVKIDGADITGGTLTGATRSGATITPDNTEALGTYVSPALSGGAHTIEVTLTTGTGNRLEVIGAEQVRSGTGLRMMNFGVGSTKIAALAATGTNWFKNGHLPVAAAPAGFAADLVSLDMEINDATPGSATMVATYKADYQTAIDRLRANGADLILHTSNPCNGYDFTAYTKAIYELADTNDLPVIDFQDRWATYTSANGYGLMSDNLHPNASGYTEKAQALLTALGFAA
ncbi:SGNH/GDSL hydrolase family protein [Nocardioides lianchengensis]|uniref:GDSL-like Lipase/Acylhydrolase family protein n=1 Tax=Nocardioides lianchengensis TaxID=1045774 RepID=A0A1G6LTS3_9ACTN|nr:SGNH/GDSL hydrolase family protein [Nocardioides lianchengensis]NYG12447.1 hypothetical protein [Nocardioides lianchengensis]SDC46609.1 GDSL-like Lipase/Acylhydrolase family protein [Nocardioides lianchengensis]